MSLSDTIEVRAARAVISGVVQGVFYRQSTSNEARARDLAGWVKNLPDGRVELYVEGPEREVEALLDWCRRGPPAARVSEVAVTWTRPQGVEPPFEIRR